LYVVSGSVEHPAGDEAYRDRLYINDGAHAFKRAPPETLPDLRDSGSSVAPADFDGDGDIDLFVGSRSIPGQYPRSAENRLLVNNGGRFTDEAPDALRQAGMVTDASWVDVDGDERPDLIVTTDWGPIRIFANRDGELVESTAEAGLANRLGWWKAVAAGDLDGDGDNDLVVTNIGLNTKYRADAASPEVLFYGDVDGSGVMQIVEARRENGTLYPRRGFRAAQAAMPMLKEKFKSFHEYAKASLAEIYTEERLQAAERLEVNTLESGLAVNDGKGRFEFRPLPRLAQIAPSSDIEVVDLTGDGKLDIVMAQNLYGAQPETGHMDGGLGLVLVGSGNCEFQPLWPNRSGIVVPGDARAVHAVDLNGDGARDLVFATNNGAWQAFYRRTSGESSVATSNQPSVTRPTK
jgi:enediyne biosynthesis protein E4